MKQTRARHTHELLMDSAAAEFVRHGFSGTNLSDVVARARLTKGALYGHFTSKAELAEELERRFERAWGEVLASSGASPRRLVIELARRVDDDVQFAAGLRLTRDAALGDQRDPAPFGALRRHLEALIDEGRREGRIGADHEPGLLARFVVALLMGACSNRWTAADRAGGMEEQVREMWDVVVPVLGD
ncbi:TetR family transcriptional regulator [Streptomyces sennicomposti]|uniref:TetR family transcriptional regulator n=1 Tax=Streptomyces sennicomposti TaxID=2873384 RepID=UPI0027DF4D77|nr:TetR family transcriptional regulator [Streptomyces sennicomposti]